MALRRMPKILSRGRGRGVALRQTAKDTGPMKSIVGVDLSGPTNIKDTATVWLVGADGGLRYEGHQLGADEATLRGLVADLANRASVAVG